MTEILMWVCAVCGQIILLGGIIFFGIGVFVSLRESNFQLAFITSVITTFIVSLNLLLILEVTK